ncbi:DUF448 domain-containing protein [Sphingomonas sp. G124]|uniref:DUF448 domain-containing protein n=1 Tax=Sphingomonas cremea TaxID=2904799 RepID=A0A9X1QI22_9SPHN|nr:DUF448 domain-containing protein [Sphingomonas cremea]MCF2513515.1 DUF448 domain-containing protein [Sphingomonas cremea]
MRTRTNDRLNAADGDVNDAGPERTCVLTRATRPKDQLIRLALGPDGQVAPDVRARAPGRGAWIGVGRKALDEANAKGKLKGALARAFKTGDIHIPADLGDRIEATLRAQALDRLGLEARGGTLVTGAERVEAAARQGKVRLLIHAADAGEDGRKRLDQAWRVGGGDRAGLVFPEGRTILSMALGRENVVHIALTDAAAARRVTHAIDRWQAFIDPDAGLDGGRTAGPSAADEFVDEGNA